MHDLKTYLHDKYGKPAREISKTQFGNMVIDRDFEMISWDDAATCFNETNNEFKEKFSTADGLIIIEKKNKNQLFFFEFKNLNFSDKQDNQMAVYHLKNNMKKMKECEHDCKLVDNLEKISENLVDISKVSLRSKPCDSISLFYKIMKKHYNLEDKKACDKLFKTDKFFFLVSKTEFQYPQFHKNKSNRQQIMKPLEFLKRFEPYHYNMVFAVNQEGFDRFFYKRNKDFLRVCQ